MRSKPIRKNANKERIFTQKQNIQDFDYLKTHRGKVDGENPELAREKHGMPYAFEQSFITSNPDKKMRKKNKFQKAIYTGAAPHPNGKLVIKSKGRKRKPKLPPVRALSR